MHWIAHQIASATLTAAPVHDAFDYVTLGIASVGAITGIAALGATFGLFFLSGPRLKVIAGTGLSTVNGIWGVSVTATNRGRTAATLDGPRSQLLRRRSRFQVSRGRWSLARAVITQYEARVQDQGRGEPGPP